MVAYNPSNVFAWVRLVEMCHMTEYAPTKTGEYGSNIPQFSKLCMLQGIS